MVTELYGSKIKKLFLKYQKCIDINCAYVEKLRYILFQHVYTIFLFFFLRGETYFELISCIYMHIYITLSLILYI